ncbi:MAG: hypothetical protein HYX92_05720 [Chloroflexi bacterium]|nr:hypothetical protein [Chloroflexota bacterium]
MTSSTDTSIVRIKKAIEPVLQPRNIPPESGGPQDARLAPRLRSLEGARIGFYNNRKPFAANALPAVERVLKEKGVRDIFVGWSTTSNKPPDETLDSLAQADAVVLAGAD